MRGALAALAAVLALVGLGAAPAGDPDVPERYISVDEAKALLDLKQRVSFLDVRSPEQFDELHIAGAHNMFLREFPRRLAEISRTDFVVLY
ncbi:MAG TPA: rhodanese-like domain-containing protein [Verrucomicrobiae bacterium]|jgi:rhodanese-related sulfurtransferase|nr:rhodanese-like domain-containing protein [Verrucomicrobiae bacterium]